MTPLLQCVRQTVTSAPGIVAGASAGAVTLWLNGDVPVSLAASTAAWVLVATLANRLFSRYTERLSLAAGIGVAVLSAKVYSLETTENTLFACFGGLMTGMLVGGFVYEGFKVLKNQVADRAFKDLQKPSDKDTWYSWTARRTAGLFFSREALFDTLDDLDAWKTGSLRSQRMIQVVGDKTGLVTRVAATLPRWIPFRRPLTSQLLATTAPIALRHANLPGKWATKGSSLVIYGAERSGRWLLQPTLDFCSLIFHNQRFLTATHLGKRFFCNKR